MGLNLVDKTADFSAVSLGHAGLYTSVTSGLQELFETRRNASKAGHNSAPSGEPGHVVGSPTILAGSSVVSLNNGMLFTKRPTGSHTLIIVAKTKNGGVANDVVAGSFLTPSTAGATYFYNYNWRIGFESTSFASGAVPPLTGMTTRTAFIDMPASASFELFAGIVESGVSLRLHHPKTGTVVTTSATGRDFVYNNPGLHMTVPNGAASHEIALFAYWDRVLTPTEIATFYAEITPQLARSGVII